jgi:hypothetical protein
MSFYDNDEIYLRDFEDKQFDAEKFKAFMDNLAQDIDGYGAKAMYLEAGYGKYYNNETYGGRAADASKEFIGNGQRDKLHVQNRNIQKELYMACADVKEAFEEMVDPSPKARISREVLRHIKKDHQGRYEEMDVLGCEIESMVREVINDFSDLADFEYFDAKPVREIYDEFCGNGGCMDKCIQKLEMFDEYAESMMFKKDITGKSALLQDNIRNTAGALDAMKIYNPSIAHNSVGLVALGTNVSYLDNGLASLWAAASNGTKMNVKIFATDKDAAEYLDAQMKILCDDDDSNDADAIANINATVQGFLYMEVVDGKKYVAYDQEKIEGTLKHLEKGGLAYQLLSSVDEQIKENKKKGVAVPNAITKLGIGGRFENTKLEVRKDGAGVRLEVTSNNDFLPLNEIKHKPVAYAATEESAKNYFMNGKSYDWDAIKAWYNIRNEFNDNYHERSIEYDVLAFEINNMSDKDVEELINSATAADYNHTIDVSSRKYTILADRYMLQMQGLRNGGSQAQLEILGYTGKEFENKYTRAVLIKNISDWLCDLPIDKNYIVNISYERSNFAQNDYDEEYCVDVYGDRVYTASIKTCENCFPYTSYPEDVISTSSMSYDAITVHPYSNYSEIQDNLLEDVCVTVKGMGISISEESKDFVVSQTVGYILGKVSDATYFGYAIESEVTSVLKDMVETEAKIQGINEVRDLSSAAHSMMLKGSSVHVSGLGNQSFYISELDYDDRRLVFNVAAYNKTHGTEYTIAQMKEEFQNNSGVFQDYNAWYGRYGDNEANSLEVDTAIKLGDEGFEKEEIRAMSAQEMEDYLLGN